MPSETPGTANRVVRVCGLLNRHRARYLVAGGVAANLHGSVRATRDVDLLEGVRIPYQNLDDLIASKQTGRHSDEADLEVLRGLRK